jgi:hypothetical protein
MLCAKRITNPDSSGWYFCKPFDHPESTDESISDPNTAIDQMDVTN